MKSGFGVALGTEFPDDGRMHVHLPSGDTFALTYDEAEALYGFMRDELGSRYEGFGNGSGKLIRTQH